MKHKLGGHWNNSHKNKKKHKNKMSHNLNTQTEPEPQAFLVPWPWTMNSKDSFGKRIELNEKNSELFMQGDCIYVANNGTIQRLTNQSIFLTENNNVHKNNVDEMLWLMHKHFETGEKIKTITMKDAPFSAETTVTTQHP